MLILQRREVGRHWNEDASLMVYACDPSVVTETEELRCSKTLRERERGAKEREREVKRERGEGMEKVETLA